MLKHLGKYLAGLAMIAMTAAPATAADWPERPITWIVPYSAGGGIDFVVRQLNKEVSSKLGQSIVVENKPSAGTIVGAQALLNDKPDGYTVGTFDATALAYNPALYERLPYDPKNFTYIAGMGVFPLVIAVNAASPYKTLADLIKDARERPELVTCATPGVGTPHALALDLFSRLTNLKITHVPYKGGAPAAQALVASQVTMDVTDIATVLAFQKSNQVRILAIIMPKRIDILPDVPTIEEAGVKGMSANAWTGIVGPPGMPQDVVVKLNKAINEGLVASAFQAQVHDNLALQAMLMSPAEFQRYATEEREFWSKQIKESGITLQAP
ncbi:MAG: tripartite tricarboxylate transporter substrate binding protein [Pseudomonadales bacterium]|jgi:tripartite-type tricarboxylate transporter receptor subunit TctC|nr:tripartite tricarboxylate transporter substrate binding protein [Pseudomonadales bacterium]